MRSSAVVYPERRSAERSAVEGRSKLLSGPFDSDGLRPAPLRVNGIVAVAIALLTTAACSGPPASDAEVCRDVIRRLCVSRCPDADAKLGITPTDDCTALLTARSFCGSDDFKFSDRGVERAIFV